MNNVNSVPPSSIFAPVKRVFFSIGDLGGRAIQFIKQTPGNIIHHPKATVIFSAANAISFFGARLILDQVKFKKDEKAVEFLANVTVVGGLALLSNMLVSRLINIPLSHALKAAIVVGHVALHFLLPSAAKVKETTEELKIKAEKAAKEAKAAAHKFKEDAEKGIEDFEKKAKDGAHHLKEEAKEGVEDVKNKAAKALDAVNNKKAEEAKKLEDEANAALLKQQEAELKLEQEKQQVAEQERIKQERVKEAYLHTNHPKHICRCNETHALKNMHSGKIVESIILDDKEIPVAEVPNTKAFEIFDWYNLPEGAVKKDELVPVTEKKETDKTEQTVDSSIEKKTKE